MGMKIINRSKDAVGSDGKNGCDKTDMDDDEILNKVRNAGKCVKVRNTTKVAGKTCMSGTTEEAVIQKKADIEKEIKDKSGAAAGNADKIKSAKVKEVAAVNGEVCLRA